jgi:transcriptional regulator with XRE-family HTH domain
MSIDKIKQKLFQNSIKDSGWLEKAQWRQENEDWLDISFSIAVKMLSALSTNKKAGVFPRNQKELAEAMKCTPQYVNKLLKGEENLQIETICKIQRILGIKLIEVPKVTITQTVQYETGTSWFEKLTIKSPAINITRPYSYEKVEIEVKVKVNYELAA